MSPLVELNALCPAVATPHDCLQKEIPLNSTHVLLCSVAIKVKEYFCLKTYQNCAFLEKHLLLSNKFFSSMHNLETVMSIQLWRAIGDAETIDTVLVDWFSILFRLWIPVNMLSYLSCLLPSFPFPAPRLSIPGKRHLVTRISTLLTTKGIPISLFSWNKSV